MTLRKMAFAALALVSIGWDRSTATRFAELPPGKNNPEGITVDGAGNVYVADFAVQGTDSKVGEVVVFDPAGRLSRVLHLPGTSQLLLGLDFHPTTGELLVIDFGGHQVVRVDPGTGATAPFASMPAGSGLNALTFDRQGNVYVSDSFGGTIFRTGAHGGAVTTWKTDPLLATTGTPPFGANGMAFNQAHDSLFVANTGDDRVIRIKVDSVGNAKDASVFVNSINGADGLIIDEHDNLWVAANQADEIVVVDKTGKAIAKLGDFDGIDEQGRPVGLLFPASLVFHGGFLYVTNLSLDIRLFGLPQAVDSQWAAQVKRHTVARIRARIPGAGNDD